MKSNAEHLRLSDHHDRSANWKNWGPYLSERAWGTVREDYSETGTAWDYFPHDHARSRAYRWNEDGLGGICDRSQYLCFALALWNGNDPILKERLFGLTGPEGNHGEDVKEYYYYLDSSPTHSYMKMLYKYPHAAFPYDQLIRENGLRGPADPEYELMDTGIFREDRYFDVSIEYAKAAENDILIRVTAYNCGPDPALIHLLPTIWFRNTWSWGYPSGPMKDVPGLPGMKKMPGRSNAIEADHPALGTYYFYAGGQADMLFTENETNYERLFGVPNGSPFVKDAFHRYIIHGETEAVNPLAFGTKACAHYKKIIPVDGRFEIRLRLSESMRENPFYGFNRVFSSRKRETDEFYAQLQSDGMDVDRKNIQRQAFAGMLWSKQMYYLDMEQWLDGDPGTPPPSEKRKSGRNKAWRHLNNFDIISMPDKWEYPWYAAWDLAFHCIPFALLDPDFAKRQLILLTREWFMHPNGQLPAYEWAYGDVNPPVHAWAVWRVYRIDAKHTGYRDTTFLKAVFHKLLLNFTWWVNREDADGNNVFQGGFLGLDNISLFDRSADLPIDGHIDQSDGTAWMAFYCLVMLRISLELAQDDSIYEDLATKFYEHFLGIAVAMSDVFRDGQGLWDDEDRFFYDILHLPDGGILPLKVRSLVGLMPLFAVETIGDNVLKKCPDFTRRMHWMAEHRKHLTQTMAVYQPEEGHKRHIFTILTPERLRDVLRYAFDENEFLSEYGIRSLSKVHQRHPFRLSVGNAHFSINYQPAESETGLFGGNSNWRGPIWFPINFLIIESLKEFYKYLGDDFQVEFPSNSGNFLPLNLIADRLTERLVRLFAADSEGKRPIYGKQKVFQENDLWKKHILFYEYFNGDTGAGLGASHQTGWTGLVATLLQDQGENDR